MDSKFNKTMALIFIFAFAAIAILGCNGQTLPAGSEPTSSSQISDTDKTEPVSFNYTIVVYKSSGVSDIKSDFEARIICSYAELVEFQNNDKEFGSDYISNNYNDAFFEENAVILICTKHGSGSIRDVINKIYKENGKLVIDYTTLKPDVLTDDIRYWRIMVQVKKADVDGITEVVPRQTSQTTPSGKQFKPDSTEYVN
ncbi:MAG TPA: hypothetical protein PLG48_00565 [Candidatus Avimonas sp.]|nr:hypothetical protein [Candidatus Avimonas sp.]